MRSRPSPDPPPAPWGWEVECDDDSGCEPDADPLREPESASAVIFRAILIAVAIVAVAAFYLR